MNRIRRSLIAALGAALAPLPAATRAQQDGDTGHTTLKNALPTENPAKVEVAEFFWYGCIHCYNLEPALEAWLPKLPANAYFRRIPAVFNQRWGHDALIFYAFDALGLIGKLHRPLFDAIHKDHLKTDDPAAFDEWLGRNGVDAKTFQAAMTSFGVQSKLKRAAQFTAASQIGGTPALMIQGRYTISTEQGGTHQGMLASAERLIAALGKNLPAGK